MRLVRQCNNRRTTVSTRKRSVAAVTTLVISAAFVLMTTGAASAYDFPSTNDENRAANLPHVNLVSTGPGTVTLDFVNPRNSIAFFEYRLDGQTVGTTPHPVVTGDVVHPGFCVDGRNTPNPGCFHDSTVQTLAADATVEVRLALGGERDWDFDWTPFAVGPKNECGEPGTNRFSVGDSSVAEGDSGALRKLRIPVTINNPSASEISVDYTVDEGSATAPEDFDDPKVGQARTLKFKPNTATTKLITVKVVPDTDIEGDEDVTVTLSNPTGGYEIGRETGTGTIVDDDDGTTGQAVAITGTSSCEGDVSATGNKMNYQLTLREPATAITKVTVTVTDGSATGGDDYKAIAKPKTLTFNPGQLQKSLALTVFADLDSEAAETVDAVVASPTPVLPFASSAEVVILNDDEPLPPAPPSIV
jgi:hypothetical protein